LPHIPPGPPNSTIGLAPLVGRLDDAPIRVVPHGTETLNLLVAYAGAIANEQSLHTPELQRLVVTHIHDLIAATVGATRDGWAIAEGRGIRAARVRSIMADITANLGDCDLTVVAVARRQRVTPRYVHKLLEREGRRRSPTPIASRPWGSCRIPANASATSIHCAMTGHQKSPD